MQRPSPDAGTASPVRIWEEQVVFPTYAPQPPERLPMFLERRVYQGSSGAVYPLPLIEGIAGEPAERAYRGVYLENEYVRVLVLPEIGGRIHAALDRTNGYDFLYHNHVIKPALVGLTGPWISGGIEFNWPQHHRPTTFMPVDYTLYEHADGGKTVWVGEIEPMNRMKGMAGITLRPGRSTIEVAVQLYNRTPLPQSFLWWSNAAVRVNDRYQAIFPPDVAFVADHARRAVSDFPIAHGTYYGIDYAPGTDISWWKNVPVPTSYMALRSRHDFLAGYDHGREAGMIHVADRHVSPGKKLWTWGAAAFGSRWNEHLTDADGPYIELMAGVYSDNQPDFAWLQPYETRTFTQYWYPLRRLGGVKDATADGAVTVERRDGAIQVGANTTAPFRAATIAVTEGASVLWQRTIDIAPDAPFSETLRGLAAAPNAALGVALVARDGREIVRYRPQSPDVTARPAPATPAPQPEAIATTEELYLTGLHLEQYRHATYDPDPYYREALVRDTGDARANTALGLLLLRRGAFEAAADHFRRAIARLTASNPNPYDGEPFYHLGVALRFLGRDDEAYDAFFKATWNGGWQAAGSLALAELAACAGRLEQALAHAGRSIELGRRNTRARNLAACLLRALGRLEEAAALAQETGMLDPLDFWSRRELARIYALQGLEEAAGTQRAALGTLMRDHAPSYLDLAGDYAGAGLWDDAAEVLAGWAAPRGEGADPLVLYHLGYYTARRGDCDAALAYYRRAAEAPPDYCFPNRLESIAVLQHAQQLNPTDARAPYYLGNLFYDRRRHRAAIALWERARDLDDSFAIVHRNLGLAYFNGEHDIERARGAYERARSLAPADARLLYERDQLDKRLNAQPAERLARLLAAWPLVAQRDDLYLELVALHTQLGQYDTALDLLARRQIRPWEGGEGLALAQHATAHLLRGRRSLAAGDAGAALRDFEASVTYPANLGETRHPVLTSEAAAYYHMGLAFDALGEQPRAIAAYERAAGERTQQAAPPYYRGMALRMLGRQEAAVEEFRRLLAAADQLLTEGGRVDYFATSLPTFRVFEDDPGRRARGEAHYLRGLGYAGLGRVDAARAEFQAALALDRSYREAQSQLEDLDGRA